MDEGFNIERHKADQARARALGFDYARLREIILLAGSDCEEGISVGRAVELIREIGLRAVDAAVAEDRAAVAAYLRDRGVHAADQGIPLTDALPILAGYIERGEHATKSQ